MAKSEDSGNLKYLSDLGGCLWDLVSQLLATAEESGARSQGGVMSELFNKVERLLAVHKELDSRDERLKTVFLALLAERDLYQCKIEEVERYASEKIKKVDNEGKRSCLAEAILKALSSSGQELHKTSYRA